jgi:uncharacterized metal-binding protein (TIGR02443 family)
MPERRFIAGAVCPHCGEIDKIVMLLESVDKRRECVSCGYRDALAEPQLAHEPTTRVNAPRPGESSLAHEEEIQILKLGESGPGSSQ